MKKNKIRPGKNFHVSKTDAEKKSYGTLINLPTKQIDDTFNNEKSDLSFFETGKDFFSLENRKDIKSITKDKRKRPYKSPRTRFNEHIKPVGLGILMAAVLTVCVGVVWSQQREMGKLSTNVDGLLEKYKNVDNEINKNGTSSVEIIKDLEFIKLRLQKVENRLRL